LDTAISRLDTLEAIIRSGDSTIKAKLAAMQEIASLAAFLPPKRKVGAEYG
jgi:hypothetical protein